MRSREINKTKQNTGFPVFLHLLSLSFVHHLYYYVLNIKTDSLRFIFIYLKKIYITTANRKCTFPISIS